MSPDKIKIIVDGKYVTLSDLVALAPNARTVDARGCTGLSALPDLPNAEYAHRELGPRGVTVKVTSPRGTDYFLTPKSRTSGTKWERRP